MIIGLVGFQRVGKSTAAKYLEDKYGFVRHNMKNALVAETKERFPDLLQEMIKIYSTIGLDLSLDDLFTVKPPLMRALLQNYGTNVRRADDPDYWTDQWYWKYEMNYEFFSDVVTDDVRFLNEAKEVKDNGGILIRLTRPDVTTGGQHVSETEQLEIKVDYTIETRAGDTESLYKRLDEIVGMLQLNNGQVSNP